MDNVTHTLAGTLVAEVVCRFRRETRAELRTAAYVLSALANNLPDTDIVYTWITGPKPLGSLLHHRGHTHTLLLALPAAWLLYRGLLYWLARRKQQFSGSERGLLLGLALAGPLLHLSMDFGNNYGVHPFWPLSGRWFYGDTIFIVEPLWWAVTIPVLSRSLTRTWLKLALWVLLSGLLVVAWFAPFVVPLSRYAFFGLTGLTYLIARWSSPRVRCAWAVAAALAVAVTFRLGSAAAQTRLQNALEAAFPALEVHDLVLSPLPANPACWEGLAVGTQAGVYRVIRSSIALPPLTAEACVAGADVEPTAKVVPLERAPRDGVQLRTAYEADVSVLQALRSEDCRFRALLEFTRVPYVQWSPAEGSSPPHVYAGDARYDRGRGLDFSDIELPNDPHSGPCPRFVPGWREPRAELFQP